MRKFLISLGVVALAAGIVAFVVQFVSLEQWAARQPGVERVHAGGNRSAEQLEVWVDDAKSARTLVDAVDARSQGDEYNVTLNWDDGVERLLVAHRRMEEEAWRLGALELPPGITSQRIGTPGHDFDEVRYTARGRVEALPPSTLRTTLNLGPVSLRGYDTGVVNLALERLESFDLPADDWTADTVVDVAAHIGHLPGSSVSGLGISVEPRTDFDQIEPALRVIAQGAGTVEVDYEFTADLPLDDCAALDGLLPQHFDVLITCGEHLKVRGPGEQISHEMAALADVARIAALVDSYGTRLVVKSEDGTDPAALITAIRGLAWEGERHLEIDGVSFVSTATGSAREVRKGGDIVELWNASATS